MRKLKQWRGAVKDGWAFLVVAATIAGLYWAALAVNAVPVFWLLLAAAVLWVVIRRVVPVLATYLQRIRDYPRLLRVAAESQQKAERLQHSLGTATAVSDISFELGRKEGLAQAIGAALAVMPEVPRIVGIVEIGQGVGIVAKYGGGNHNVGARYSVRVSHGRAYRGTVEVAELDTDGETLYLRAVDPKPEKFWEALAERVEIDTSPPPDVELEPFTIDQVSKNLPLPTVDPAK